MTQCIFDQIRAACTRPATLGHIAKELQMTPSEAFWAVQAAAEQGKIVQGRYYLWEAVSHE